MAQTAITNSEKTHHSIDAEHGVEEKATASTAADVNSPTDRAQLDERVQKLEPMANPPTQLFRVPTVHGSTVT